MSQVRIADPDDLTTAEKAIATHLGALAPADFDRSVAACLENPDDAIIHALRSSALAEETMNALLRLRLRYERERAQARTAARRDQAAAKVTAVNVFRRELKPYVNLAASAAAATSLRSQAEEILGRVRYAELRRIMRDLEAGVSKRDAERRFRESIAG